MKFFIIYLSISAAFPCVRKNSWSKLTKGSWKFQLFSVERRKKRLKFIKAETNVNHDWKFFIFAYLSPDAKFSEVMNLYADDNYFQVSKVWYWPQFAKTINFWTLRKLHLLSIGWKGAKDKFLHHLEKFLKNWIFRRISTEKFEKIFIFSLK